MVEAVSSRLFDHCILKDPGLKLAIKLKKILILFRFNFLNRLLLLSSPIFLGSSPA